MFTTTTPPKPHCEEKLDKCSVCIAAKEADQAWYDKLRAQDRVFIDGLSKARNLHKAMDEHLRSTVHHAAEAIVLRNQRSEPAPAPDEKLMELTDEKRDQLRAMAATVVYIHQYKLPQTQLRALTEFHNRQQWLKSKAFSGWSFFEGFTEHLKEYLLKLTATELNTVNYITLVADTSSLKYVKERGTSVVQMSARFIKTGKVHSRSLGLFPLADLRAAGHESVMVKMIERVSPDILDKTIALACDDGTVYTGESTGVIACLQTRTGRKIPVLLDGPHLVANALCS